MIGYLKGELTDMQADHILIEVNGVGYQVQMPHSAMDRLPRLGSEITIYTHLIMREDSLCL
jgi:Holliday junction DNA helicase RuvA